MSDRCALPALAPLLQGGEPPILYALLMDLATIWLICGVVFVAIVALVLLILLFSPSQRRRRQDGRRR